MNLIGVLSVLTALIGIVLLIDGVFFMTQSGSLFLRVAGCAIGAAAILFGVFSFMGRDQTPTPLI